MRTDPHATPAARAFAQRHRLQHNWFVIPSHSHLLKTFATFPTSRNLRAHCSFQSPPPTKRNVCTHSRGHPQAERDDRIVPVNNPSTQLPAHHLPSRAAHRPDKLLLLRQIARQWRYRIDKPTVAHPPQSPRAKLGCHLPRHYRWNRRTPTRTKRQEAPPTRLDDLQTYGQRKTLRRVPTLLLADRTSHRRCLQRSRRPFAQPCRICQQ
jgi:hypothetical protein